MFLILALACAPNDSGKVDSAAVTCPDGGAAAPWYADADGDGFGDAATTESSCSAPAGMVEDATDCDDGDAGVSPASTEVCDTAGVDEDCDGLVNDEDTLAASETSPWYADEDGDGYGTGPAVVTACDAGQGYAANDEDCDDTEAQINPGERETCSDGIDNDCDGGAEGCGHSGDVEVTTDDADGYLYATLSDTQLSLDNGLSHGDIDGDGRSDVLLGASEAGYVRYGGVWIVEGPATGQTATDDADITIDNNYGYYAFGSSVLGGYDGDRDGNEDVVVGASGVDAVIVFEGPLSRSEETDGLWGYWQAPSGFGDSLATAELDGDGDLDLLMGSDDVVYGIAGTLGADGPEGNDPTLQLTVAAPDTMLAFDGDGDGLDELALGGVDGASGLVWVVPGGQSGDVAAEDVAWIVSATDATLGTTVCAADVDLDGHDDIVVGGGGQLYVVPGPIGGDVDATAAALGHVGSGSTHAVGSSFDVLDDFDGDGYPDVAVSSSGSSDLAVLVVAGPLSVDQTLDDAFVNFYDDTTDRTDGITGVGDLDGDGTEDLAIRQSQADPFGEEEAGHVYLYLGGGM